jgi:erythronate-4-phosphate dehydrogenase
MKPFILIDENIPLLAESLQPAVADTWQIAHYAGRYLPPDKLRQCEALFVRSVTRVDESVMNGTSVVFVGTATSGLEHVDTEYLRRQNIHFVDAPGCNANSVAEYVVYAMLKWSELRGEPLQGLSVGIVGYGHIGRLVAEYARRLGMKPLVYDPLLKERRYDFGEHVEYIEFAELVERAEVITNHVPFKRDGKYATVGMFGEREFSCMKDGALFVHTSRRFIALEAELLPHVQRGRLYAALDVWEQEPRINKELAACAMLATPHVAGYSFEGKVNSSKVLAEKFGEFFGSKPDMTVYERALDYPDRPHVDFADPDGLRETLQQSRQLDEDTDMLLETLATPEFQHAQLFDKLRKNYPRRREVLSL